MANSIFSKEEITKLIENYPKTNHVQLGLLFPNKTYEQIRRKITNLRKSGIKIENKKDNRDIKFLNELTPRSSYWWGFIMADGNISERGIKIEVASKDEEHIKKLSSYISSNIRNRIVKNGGFNYVNKSMTSLEIWNKSLSQKWMQILEIKEAKTYNPPNLLTFYNRNIFIYFFIGMIDGDGCIWVKKTRTYMRIELHKSWLNTLNKFSELLDVLYNIKSSVNITKKDYVILTIGDRISLQILNVYAKEVDRMERKWKKIDNIKIIRRLL